MVVILQTVPGTIQALKRQIGERQNVFYTSNYPEALAFVSRNNLVNGRVVAIMSNYYPGQTVVGWQVARLIKLIRADAWCFLYTFNETDVNPFVDGTIFKGDPSLRLDVVLQLVEAGIDDPQRIPDLQTLYRTFLRIQRPNL